MLSLVEVNQANISLVEVLKEDIGKLKAQVEEKNVEVKNLMKEIKALQEQENSRFGKKMSLLRQAQER